MNFNVLVLKPVDEAAFRRIVKEHQEPDAPYNPEIEDVHLLKRKLMKSSQRHDFMGNSQVV